MCLAALAAVAVAAAAPTVGASPSADASLSRTARIPAAFQPPSLASRQRHRSTPPGTVLRNNNNEEDAAQPSFLSTSKASVAFKGNQATVVVDWKTFTVTSERFRAPVEKCGVGHSLDTLQTKDVKIDKRA